MNPTFIWSIQRTVLLLLLKKNVQFLSITVQSAQITLAYNANLALYFPIQKLALAKQSHLINAKFIMRTILIADYAEKDNLLFIQAVRCRIHQELVFKIVKDVKQ